MSSIELVTLPEGLALQASAENFKPLIIDFVEGKANHRRLFPGKELIAKAIGTKVTYRPSVIDATAGMGRDAFVLANLGCAVTLLERSPILHALLADALIRGKQDNEIKTIIERMTLKQGDAQDLLPTLKADVVFLDPMYPHREKSALVKKELRLLRLAVGDDPDADELLDKAFIAAEKRVVVKRPRLGKYLADKKPNFSYTGQHSRFDVYLTTP